MTAPPAPRPALDLSRGGWALPWLAWTLTRGLMLAGVTGAGFYRWGFPVPGDLHLYYFWAYLFQHGLLPYRDIQLVYPPGVLAVLVMPAVSPAAFVATFLVAGLACDAAAFARLRRLPRSAGSWIWLIGAAAAGPVLWVRLDIFVAAALVMALIDAQQGRPLRAAAWLGVAASLKVWPLLLVVALIAGARQKRLATVGASLIPPALLTALVAAWGGLSQLAASVQEQTGRDLEIESVFAAPLAIARAVGFRPGQLEKGLSYQFVGSTAHVLALVASGATVLGVLAWLVGVRRRPGARLPFAALALVAILLASGKVLSPQYAAWALAPAAVLGGLAISVTAPRRHLLWGWLGLYLLTTQALFPFAYNSLLGGGPLGAIVLTVHSVAVIGLLVSAVKQWMQGPPGPHIGPIEEADTSTALHPEGLFADSSTLMLVDRPQTQLLGAGR